MELKVYINDEEYVHRDEYRNLQDDLTTREATVRDCLATISRQGTEIYGLKREVARLEDYGRVQRDAANRAGELLQEAGDRATRYANRNVVARQLLREVLDLGAGSGSLRQRIGQWLLGSST